jgi:glycerone phosphate O-acyltransferase/fatty acyl-CoA reductase
MESLYDEKIIEDYEACSLETIKNAFDRYQREGFVRLEAGGKKKESVVEVLIPIEVLEGFENKIKFFRKSAYTSFISPTEVARQSLRELSAIPKL